MRIIFLGGDNRQEFASQFLIKYNIFSDVYKDFCLNDEISDFNKLLT